MFLYKNTWGVVSHKFWVWKNPLVLVASRLKKPFTLKGKTCFKKKLPFSSPLLNSSGNICLIFSECCWCLSYELIWVGFHKIWAVFNFFKTTLSWAWRTFTVLLIAFLKMETLSKYWNNLHTFRLNIHQKHCSISFWKSNNSQISPL